MTTGDPTIKRRGITLSTRLLWLTIAFVMLAEVLIWTPSVARYRHVYIENQLDRAYLSMLALNALEEGQPSQDLEKELLSQTQTLAIVLNVPDRRMLMVGGDMPPEADLMVDTREDSVIDLIMYAFDTLAQTENRVIRAMGNPPRRPDAVIEVLFDEKNMRDEMLDFSWRILTLSIIISVFTAALVFITLRWMIVRPIARITDSMVRFRANPEDATRILVPRPRGDEIGTAEEELVLMQRDVHAALRQKNRLAALGAAVAKINHDLRNTLATAMLVSDKLQYIEDPEVKRVTPRLMRAIDRAIELCSETLNYAADDAIELRPRRFSLRELFEEIAAGVGGPEGLPAVQWQLRDRTGGDIVADRRHLMRALTNLCNNALQAGAGTLHLSAERLGGRIVIEVADDGAGLPEKARQNLFKPFAGSSRKGGTGLGLVIVRDILRAHGGDAELLQTSAKGTRFRLTLPIDIETVRAPAAAE